MTVHHPLKSDHWAPGVGQLLSCLNPWLLEHWQTVIIAAVDEPYYLPAGDDRRWHEIQFAHGYFNSVLHELAHWCVAGPERRLRPDFGYWYEPDGRSAAQQAKFEQVEVKPQAMEWHFAQACGRRFRVSVDNLSGEATDSRPFREAVAEQARRYQLQGLPARAASIVALLSDCFGQNPDQFEFCLPD